MPSRSALGQKLTQAGNSWLGHAIGIFMKRYKMAVTSKTNVCLWLVCPPGSISIKKDYLKMCVAQRSFSLAYILGWVYLLAIFSPDESSLSQAVSASADQADGSSDYIHLFPVMSNYWSSSPRCWEGWRSGLGWIKADVNTKCKCASWALCKSSELGA